MVTFERSLQEDVT